MTIDLTKPIELGIEVIRFERTGVNAPAFIVRVLSEPHLNMPNTDLPYRPILLSELTDHYIKLFEAAPRMLAKLKELDAIATKTGSWLDDVPYVTAVRALIAEIEGSRNYGEDWLRSKYLSIESFKNPEDIPPIEGGYYAKPLRVLAVTPSPDYVSAPCLMIEYQGGVTATGLVLFGADRERFEAAQRKYLAGLVAGRPVEGAAG